MTLMGGRFPRLLLPYEIKAQKAKEQALIRGKTHILLKYSRISPYLLYYYINLPGTEKII
jgi:hypothetical protein